MNMPSRKGRSAFTLLEVLLAIALVGLLMTGLNMFVFSMGELWGRNSEKRLFEQHVRAVSRFLEHELITAALPPAVKAGQAAIEPQEIHPDGGMSENLLTFELTEGSRLIIWPSHPLPEVVCSLQVRDRQGLFLLWHSRLEVHFADNSPHESLISPFVTGLAYDYYDTDMKRWVRENTLRRDATTNDYLAPQRLLVKFAYGAFTQERLIALPQPTEGLPSF